MQNPNNLSKSMRTSYIAIVLFLVSALCMKAQHDMSTDFNGLTLTIRPFYSDYVAKMDKSPVDTWSDNRYLHCQFIETIPSSLITPADTFFIDQAPVKMLPYGWTQTVAGVFLLPYIQAEYVREFNLEKFPVAPAIRWKENKNFSDRAVLRYTYVSPFQIRMNGYYSPTCFLMPEELNYFFSRKGVPQDSLRITVDASDALFYTRSDRPLVPDPIDPALKRIDCTVSTAPSIFFLYRPAFLHKEKTIEGIDIDVLFQHLDMSQKLTNASEVKLELLPLKDTAPIDSAICLLQQIVPPLDKLTKPLESSPTKVDLIVSNMKQSWDDWGFVYGKAFEYSENKVLLVDPDDYYSRVLTHEMAHLFLPFVELDQASWMSSVDKSMLNEALVEYVACVIHKKYTGESYWEEKERYVSENVDSTMLNDVSQIEEVTYTGEDSNSSYWLYYTYIPHCIHQKALVSGGDWAVAERIVSIYKRGLESNWDEGTMRPILNQFKDDFGIRF